MVRMTVDRVVFESGEASPLIWLKSEGGERLLAIAVGLAEAQAIDRLLQGTKAPRPLTHDLFHLILGKADAQVLHTTITRLKTSTFYARVGLRASGKDTDVDARPSDGIALALRASAPIMVAEEVIREAEIPTEKTESEEYETFKRLMSTMSDEVESTDLESGSDLDIGPDDESVESQEE